MKKLLTGVFVTAVAGLPLAHADGWDSMKEHGANLEQQGKDLQQKGKDMEKRGQNLKDRGDADYKSAEHARDTGVRDYHTGVNDYHTGVDKTEAYGQRADDTLHHRKHATVEHKTTTRVKRDGDVAKTTTTTTRSRQ